MKKLFITLACLVFIACSHDDAIRILEAEGYENIQITNFGWLRCRKNAAEKTSFVAQRDGEEVGGSVCLPYLYRYTVTRIRKGEEIIDDEIYGEKALAEEQVSDELVGEEEFGEEIDE